MAEVDSNNDESVRRTGGVQLDTTWVNFELGEDVRDERRLEQDAKWAGAKADGRTHFSNREFVIEYRDSFLTAISDFERVTVLAKGMFQEGNVLNKLNEFVMQTIAEFAFPGQGPLIHAVVRYNQLREQLEANAVALQNDFYDKTKHFHIYLRKRPLLSYDYAINAYDVARVNDERSLTLHEGKLARNGRLLSMTHHHFAFDRVFHEHDNNDTVCAEAIMPLLRHAEEGNQSTVICFGQTGTGKTHTLYGALNFISRQLVGKSARVVFYEVHGNKCYDLLQDRRIVHLRFDAAEQCHVRGARVVTLNDVQSEQQVIEVLRDALQLRSSLATERNNISSRSHAVCSIEILATGVDSSGSCAAGCDDEETKENQVNGLHSTQPQPHSKCSSSSADDDHAVYGRITLVDLAGSERNYETLQMTAALHKESADINLALMALKDCFRAYHLMHSSSSSSNSTTDTMSSSTSSKKPSTAPATGRIPYRSSTLTKVLKDCFDVNNNTNNTNNNSKRHRTAIIATVSPSPVDLQHSLNTIGYVTRMSQVLPAFTDSVTVEVPKVRKMALSSRPVQLWDHEEVIAWISHVQKGRFAHLVLPESITGRELLGMTAGNFTALFAAQDRSARNEQEGAAWVITNEQTRRLRAIGTGLYQAIHREEALRNRFK